MENSQAEQTGSSTSSEKLTLPIGRPVTSEAKCIVCKSPNGRFRITPEARLQAFIDTSILIGPNSRSCTAHLQKDFLLKETALTVLETWPFSHVDAKEITEFLNNLRDKARKKGLDFDDRSATTDNDYYRLTGLTKNQFDHVVKSIHEQI